MLILFEIFLVVSDGVEGIGFVLGSYLFVVGGGFGLVVLVDVDCG